MRKSVSYRKLKSTPVECSKISSLSFDGYENMYLSVITNIYWDETLMFCINVKTDNFMLEHSDSPVLSIICNTTNQFGENEVFFLEITVRNIQAMSASLISDL